MSRWPQTPRVELVTTDGFLYPNAELERRGLLQRKGFPESHDRALALDVHRRRQVRDAVRPGPDVLPPHVRRPPGTIYASGSVVDIPQPKTTASKW